MQTAAFSVGGGLPVLPQAQIGTGGYVPLRLGDADEIGDIQFVSAQVRKNVMLA